MATLQLLKSQIIESASCPSCGAEPGQLCNRSKGSACHAPRVKLARTIAHRSLDRLTDEVEIERLRQAAINRIRGMDVTKDDRQTCIQFLGATRPGRQPTTLQAKLMKETIRFAGDWSPIDDDPFEIQGNRVVALPKAGELF